MQLDFEEEQQWIRDIQMHNINLERLWIKVLLNLYRFSKPGFSEYPEDIVPIRHVKTLFNSYFNDTHCKMEQKY